MERRLVKKNLFCYEIRVNSSRYIFKSGHMFSEEIKINDYIFDKIIEFKEKFLEGVTYLRNDLLGEHHTEYDRDFKILSTDKLDQIEKNLISCLKCDGFKCIDQVEVEALPKYNRYISVLVIP